MPNQSGKSETLVIAEKAGIATKFPGLSETYESFKAHAKEDYNKSISLNKDLTEINRIRLARYNNKEESYKITGTSETRSKYPNHFLDNPNLIQDINLLTATTISNNKNNKVTEPYYKKKFLVGNTEYFDRYKKPANEAERAEASLNINPSVDLSRGSYGRPYEQLDANNMQTHYDTQYKSTHQWPVPENLTRFEWLNNH